MPAGFWDPSNAPDPLEVFDSEWVVEMITLDRTILSKRSEVWDGLPDETRRLFEIDVEL